MDPNVLKPDHAPSRSTILDLALQIGLLALLVYACSRFISPFTGLLLWSAILAVMLYPLHLRLVAADEGQLVADQFCRFRIRFLRHRLLNNGPGFVVPPE